MVIQTDMLLKRDGFGSNGKKSTWISIQEVSNSSRTSFFFFPPAPWSWPRCVSGAICCNKAKKNSAGPLVNLPFWG